MWASEFCKINRDFYNNICNKKQRKMFAIYSMIASNNFIAANIKCINAYNKQSKKIYSNTNGYTYVYLWVMKRIQIQDWRIVI